MPGFVDVSNMTAQEVKRLGQADDDYEAPQRTWKPRTKPQGVKHSVDNVWGAACAAQRINGSYVKEAVYDYDDNGPKIIKRRNRDIVTDILANPALLTVEDIAQGQECRKFLQQDLTFRALKSQLTEFDLNVAKTLAVNEEFDTAVHRLELALVACLPASQARAIARQETQSRVRQATAEFSTVGEKVSVGVEVISANYSQNYGIYWITAITQDNHAVFFSNRKKFDAGTWLTIKGTVKAHRDGKTQLTRVKLV